MREHSGIKNIVMDAGGVFIDTRTSVTAEAIGVSIEELKVIRHKSKDIGLWDDWILGHINGELFEELLCRTLKPEQREIARKWLTAGCYGGGLPVHNEILQDMHRLHNDGYAVFILSNIVDRTLSYLVDQEIVTSFDGGIYSCKVGAMKPDPYIYYLLLSQYQLDPKATVFFDDKYDNCVAAERLGIESHHWMGRQTLLKVFPYLSLL